MDCIVRETTLKPQIFQYLDKEGNVPLDMLVDVINKKTGVAKEKIKFRIEKLHSRGELRIRKGIVSRILSSDQIESEFDEIYKLGSITLARKNNIVSVESEFKRDKIAEIGKNAKKYLTLARKDVEEGLSELEELILEDYNPLDVTAYVTFKNTLIDPEMYTESSFKGKQLLPEIVQNIVLKNALEKYSGTNRKDIDRFHTLASNLGSKLNALLLVEAIARDDLTAIEAEVYLSVMSGFLWIRGDAYPQHYREVATELFSKISDFLKNKGYTIEEYWATVDEVNRQIQYNYNEPVRKLHLEHERFIEFADNEARKGTDPNEIVDKYRQESAERTNSLQLDFEKLSEIALKGSFEIEVNNAINQKLLDSVSMEFGENRLWTSPFDKSDIATRPVIKADNRYYCFLTGHLIRNVIQIIESQLTQEDREEIKYSDLKGSYFETKAIGLLNKIVEGQAYAGLTYQKDNEIDGIILLSDAIFLIEVKGRKKRTVAGVSDVLKLTKDDFKAHIVEAIGQTERAYEYIQCADEVEFKDKMGLVTLKIRKDSFKKLYQIIVCLESFSKLAIDINLIRTWIPGLIKANQYPWIVTIYDLIVISDFLKKDAFLSFLDERLKVAEYSTLEAVDEIDFLGYFLKHGSLTRLRGLKPADSTLIVGFSDDIDRWYSYLRGEVDKAEKPVLRKSL